MWPTNRRKNKTIKISFISWLLKFQCLDYLDRLNRMLCSSTESEHSGGSTTQYLNSKKYFVSPILNGSVFEWSEPCIALVPTVWKQKQYIRFKMAKFLLCLWTVGLFGFQITFKTKSFIFQTGLDNPNTEYIRYFSPHCNGQGRLTRGQFQKVNFLHFFLNL